MRIRPPPQLVKALGSGLVNTLHYRREGLEHLQHARSLSPSGSVIYCLWHQHLLMVIGKHRQQKVAALTSLSNDGTLVATYLNSVGLRAIRGSSSRGGLKAARELVQAITDGWDGAITVDGPRGPNKEVKPGPFEIARRSGVPIVPVAARANFEYAFKRAWDCFRAPLPTAKVCLVYGEPIILPPEYPTPAELAARRLHLGRRLHDLEAQAAAHVGRANKGPLAKNLSWMQAAAAEATA